MVEKFLGRFRKIRIAMGVISGENQVLVADQLNDVANIRFIAFTANHALALKVIAWLHRKRGFVVSDYLISKAYRVE